MQESRAERLAAFINETITKEGRAPTAAEITDFDGALVQGEKARRESIEQFKVANEENLRKFVSSERVRLAQAVQDGKFLPGTELSFKIRVSESGDVVATAHGCNAPGFRGSWNMTPEGEITKEPVRNARPYEASEKRAA